MRHEEGEKGTSSEEKKKEVIKYFNIHDKAKSKCLFRRRPGTNFNL